MISVHVRWYASCVMTLASGRTFGTLAIPRTWFANREGWRTFPCSFCAYAANLEVSRASFTSFQRQQHHLLWRFEAWDFLITQKIDMNLLVVFFEVSNFCVGLDLGWASKQSVQSHFGHC